MSRPIAIEPQRQANENLINVLGLCGVAASPDWPIDTIVQLCPQMTPNIW